MSERENAGVSVHAGKWSAGGIAFRRPARSAMLRWILASATLSTLVFAPGSSWAQSQQSPTSKSAPANATAPANGAVTGSTAMTQLATTTPALASLGQSAPKGRQEGITVHGYWTIEVKNPDGKVTERREFENHVVLYGEGILEGLLSGNIVPGGWTILLAGNSSNSSTQCTESTFSICALAGAVLEQGANYGSFNLSNCTPSQGCSLTLVRSFVPPVAPPPATGPNGYFQLSGSVPVASGVQNISLVATFLAACANAQWPSAFGVGLPANVPTLVSPAQCEPSQLFTAIGPQSGFPSITSSTDPLNGATLTSGSVPLFPTGAPFTAFTLANPNSTPPPPTGTPTQVPVSAGQSVSVTVQISFQ